MTVQEQAYSLINQLPEESVNAIVRIMVLMLPEKQSTFETSDAAENAMTPKMKAYLRMQELRKMTASYNTSAIQRSTALNEKYGKLA